METLTIITLFISILVSFLPIVIGILLIRHRQLIMYFKSSFTFIREEYDADEEMEHRNLFADLFYAFKFACAALGVGVARDNNEAFGINRSIVLLGKLFVAYGVVAIILSLLFAILPLLAPIVHWRLLNGF